MTRYLKSTFLTATDSDLLDARNWSTLSRRDRMNVRRAYYDSDDLYERVQTLLEEKSGTQAKILPLRNPTKQVVEFHVNHLFSGPLEDALTFVFPERSSVPNDSTNRAPRTNGNRPNPTPTVGRDDALENAIRQVHDWSNLAAKKQPAVRSFARDGELYIEIVEHPDKDQVYWNFIDSADVVDYDTDDRGFLTWIRIDVIKYRRDKGKQKKYVVTRVWSKDENSLSVYEHDKDWGTDLDKLGVEPTVTPMFASDDDTESFGVDFIPIVRAPFIEVQGKKDGQAAIDGAFDKIDEANRMATRIHRMLASNTGVKWALRANMVDPTGRPMPAPKIDVNDSGQVEFGGETVLRLPGMSELDPLVPNLDYQSMLAVLQAHLRDMEDDLPEMAYKRVREQGEISGVAIRTLLGDAIARGEEAQANLASAFIRAHQMALTIAQRAGIAGFSVAEIGTYEAGDFDHKLELRPIIPIPVTEQAQTFQLLVGGQMPVVVAMRIAGFNEDDIDEVAAELAQAEARRATNQAQALLQATADLETRRQQQGQGGNGNGNQQRQPEPAP